MTWTNITNGQLAVGAPLRSVDILALRDNITAQANGDAGAPQHQTNSIANGAITAPKINYGYGLSASGNQLVTTVDSANGVGSYALVGGAVGSGGVNRTFGSNYAIGTGFNLCSQSSAGIRTGTGLSGTWKWLGVTDVYASETYYAVCVRVA